MKKLLSILSLAILILSCSQRISYDKVTIVNDVCYLKADMSLVTGIVTESYSSFHLASEINYKDGERDGLSKTWHSNGQLRMTSNYKDGELDGLAKTWHSNGHLDAEVNWKDGKLDGLFKFWHSNGQLESEFNYKDGVKDGLGKHWYENGQLKTEVNEGVKGGQITN